MLLAIGGLPGSGKTTISQELKKLGFQTLHRDDFLGQIFNPPDYFSRSQKDIAYDSMFKEAGDYLLKGDNVVLESSFSHKSDIDKVLELAHNHQTDFRFIYCYASDEVAIRRIKDNIHPATDRTERTYLEVKRRFEKIELPYLELDTDKSIEETIKEVKSYLSL